MDEKKLFLLDAYALIYRAYYALIRSPRVTSKGFNTSAIFGFVNTLDEILRKENPSHIAVCFDPVGGHTFRHEAYEAYKAQRDKQPEDITNAIPYIKKILDAYHIPVIELEGYEADDVIGTLSRRAEQQGFVTYMMTPDKDYGQLVTEKVLMYRPSLRGEGFEIRGPRQVCERYGISSPRQVIDLLALEGDASDNIPGCPGVGEKTAAKLIAEWGSVESLLDNVDSLKGALKKKITENAESIRFSKYLVTIKTDVPLGDISIDSLVRKPEDVNALIDVYKQLEFRTFINRLSADGPKETAPKEATPLMGSLFDVVDDTPRPADVNNYSSLGIEVETLSTVEMVARAVEEAAKHSKIGMAMCASGNEAMTATVGGLALALDDKRVSYVPLTGDDAGVQEMKVALRPLFSMKGVTLVSHDVKRDYLLLKREGMTLECDYYDTSVAHYLLEPEMKHTLQYLAMRYLDYVTLDTEIGEKKALLTSGSQAVDMACERAVVALRLHDKLMPLIVEQQLSPLMNEIELPLIKVLAEMEWTGVRVDTSDLARLSMQYTARLGEMEQKVYELAGGSFNISSPMQVGEVLFQRLKIDPNAKRTKKGAFSTTEEILEKFRADHPIVDLILKIRALRKLLATYINALPELINRITGKIHTSYNQTVTATGRISSTNPNLQNIPVRSDDGREIRRAFIADPGDIFMSADYSQIELRLMADLSADKNMVDAFMSGADIHRATAAKIYHEPLDQVTDNQRRNAKTANFGIIYGISAFGLSERLGIPRSEAKMLIDGYFATYPHIREYMDESINRAREKGYVMTIKGRKRMLPDINSRSAVVRGFAERNAINAPIQGSAADIIKIAMVNIYRHMEEAGFKSRMIMQVHDELVFNVKPDELEALKELVIRDMESAYRGLVPLVVSAGFGQNWLEAH